MNYESPSSIKINQPSSDEEIKIRDEFFELYKESPIPRDQLLSNLGLFIKRQTLSRILMFNELYKKITNLHGIVCEFGVRWGANLALFESLRGIYEPYNYNRKIVGFDSFSGFPAIHDKDGRAENVKVGSYSTTLGYEKYLERVLGYHELESPLSHIKKFELIKGDASVTINEFLKDNPQTIIAFAYFDFDIYEPTKNVLQAIRPHLTKGAVIGFDELNCKFFPGETRAFDEVLGINNYKIFRDQNNPMASYIIF